MALKNPNLYPQFSVFVWTEEQKMNGEWEPFCRCVDKFDNELEAFSLYKSIPVGDGVVEVDLQKDTEDDCFPIRHKDTAGEYIY